MEPHRYPIAPRGVFATIQGEGALLGLPMVFVRLAGCSVGCELCDTDYHVDRRVSAASIADEVRGLRPAGWVWITGGEPTDHDLVPLCLELRKTHRIALATAGTRPLDGLPPLDFVSVSPHDPATWRQRWGSELKLVPGLHGHRLDAFVPMLEKARFEHHYACPCDGDLDSRDECVRFVMGRDGWRLGIQAHKRWQLP